MENQYNLKTNLIYQGQNQGTLQEVKEERGYKSDAWVTFLQAKDLNKKLVNAKGKGIFLRTFVNSEEVDKKGKQEVVTRPVGFIVFNADHLEDIKEEVK